MDIILTTFEDADANILNNSALLLAKILKTKDERLDEFLSKIIKAVSKALDVIDILNLNSVLAVVSILSIQYIHLFTDKTNLSLILINLILKLRNLSDCDKNLPVILEILTNLVRVSGNNMKKYLKGLLNRSLRIIDSNLDKANLNTISLSYNLILEVIRTKILPENSYSVSSIIEKCLNTKVESIIQTTISFYFDVSQLISEKSLSKFITSLIEMLDLRKFSPKLIAQSAHTLAKLSFKYHSEISSNIIEIIERVLLVSRNINNDPKIKESLYLSVGMFGLLDPSSLSLYFPEFLNY